MEVETQDSPFVLLNIYAPNKCAEQCDSFSKLSEELKDFVTDEDKSVVIGGDFNVTLDPDLDGRGGNKKRKDSVRYVVDMTHAIHLASKIAANTKTLRLLANQQRLTRRC